MKEKKKDPFTEWLRTESGKKAADYGTLTGVEYLLNRLWHAFQAGAKSNE